MKHLSDDDIAQELEKLEIAFQPNPMQKEKARRLLYQPTRPKKRFRMNSLLPSIVSLIVLLSVGIGFYVNIGEPSTANVTASWEGVLLQQTSHTTASNYVFMFDKDSFTIEDFSPGLESLPEPHKERALRLFKEPTLVPGTYSNYSVKQKGDTYTITADGFTYTLQQFGPRRFAGEDGIEYSTQTYVDQIEVITDDVTLGHLETAPQNEHTFLIEWGIDSMDRGNHDFESHEHGPLVVSTDFDELQRGQAVYYHTPASVIAKNSAVPEMYIGRVVGLPGETVEIKGGQVYIDGKKLDTFYGQATMHGLSEEEYFNKTPRSAIANETSTREYFNMNMAAVTVEENTVFILVDQWWRGYDSREYGPLPIEAIEGIITGTAE